MEFDPLWVTTPLLHRAEFYPLGFAVSVASNDRLVIEAAAQSWSGFVRRFEGSAVEIRCLVTPAETGDILPSEPVFRAQRNLFLVVADTRNFACCDLGNGFASAWLSDTTVSDAPYFRYHFLEGMAYSLIGTQHVAAVHAACVSLEGKGVLLAGDSGAGKSSLAYACARRGWTYTSDDMSAILLRSDGRSVLGNPSAFRFRASAGHLFPEFRGLDNHVRHSKGKPTIEVRTDALSAIRTAPECRAECVVFLNRRGDHAPDLVTVPTLEARQRLFCDPWPPDLSTRADMHAAVDRLLTVPAYELRYSRLDDAVERLEQLLLGGF